MEHMKRGEVWLEIERERICFVFWFCFSLVAFSGGKDSLCVHGEKY